MIHVYTRTGWGPEDLDCQVDTTFANHDHPDRGSVTWKDQADEYAVITTADGRREFTRLPQPGVAP